MGESYAEAEGLLSGVEPRTLTRRSNGEANKLLFADQPVHGWYRFVLSFPPHLVRHYLARFGLGPRHRVLDPFCGTGTTLVECKKVGVPSVGIEANSMACFATTVKVDWDLDPQCLMSSSQTIAQAALAELEAQGLRDEILLRVLPADPLPCGLLRLDAERDALLLTDSISPLPLHKTLVLLGHLGRYEGHREYRHQLLALARELANSIGNLEFGPEVGVGPIKRDAPVVPAWLDRVHAMAADLRSLRGVNMPGGFTGAQAEVHQGDARELLRWVEPGSVDGVITSPPYPNEKDYTRTTRLESVLLGFVRTKSELRRLKHGLVRSNTRGVYREDDDDRWVHGNPEVERIASEIEARRMALGKTSGFERMYARVTKLYFGGMARHLAELRQALRPGAHLAYVVGDQASYLRVMIRTGRILSDIATGLGYELEGIDLFRTRRATATRQELREEVVLLRWPG